MNMQTSSRFTYPKTQHHIVNKQQHQIRITSNRITRFFVHVPPTRTVSKLVLLHWPSPFALLIAFCQLLINQNDIGDHHQPIFNKQ